MAYDPWVTTTPTITKQPKMLAPPKRNAQQWNTPDYTSLTLNDPTYRAFVDQQSAQGISDRAQLAGATKRALIEAGLGNLDFANSGLNLDYVNADITPDVKQAANANPFSQTKQIDRQLADNAIALRRYLRSRGAVRSGEAGYGYQKIQDSADQARYTAAQRLLDVLAQAQASYAQAERDRQFQLAREQQAALERQMQLNPAYATAGVTNPPGAAVETLSGPPIASSTPSLTQVQKAAAKPAGAPYAPLAEQLNQVKSLPAALFPIIQAQQLAAAQAAKNPPRTTLNAFLQSGRVGGL